MRRTNRPLGKDDSEAYKSLHPDSANDTEEEVSSRDEHHQPPMDDLSVDGSSHGDCEASFMST